MPPQPASGRSESPASWPDNSGRPTPPLIVIVGETASGKSALAMELAEQCNGEIICADSWTVYKGLDIGTAKPTSADRALVPHHLLDVADPAAGFSAAQFQKLAQAAITDITSRIRLPILVGGSGLYVDSILFNYQFMPPADPAVRQQLNDKPLGELQLLIDKMELDASGIDIHNKRRVVRFIENNGARPVRNALRQNTLVLGITRLRDDLRERIAARVDDMVAQGFADEVRALGERYGWDCEAMRAPGYRAFAGYARGELSLDEAKAQFVLNDLHLAKKQRTWFKRNSSTQWVSDRSNIVDVVTTFLNKTN